MPKVPTPSDPPPNRSTRGISSSDVDRVADELLRTGLRPTVLKIRERLGTGSPNTINPMLDAWWKRLASRLDSGPHALHRIPEAVAQITEVLWLKALESARERTRAEERTTRGQLERDKREVDLRRHVLSLREAEFEDRLRERERTIGALEEQVAALTRLLQKEQASRASAERRLAVATVETRARQARAAERPTDPTDRTKSARRTGPRSKRRQATPTTRTQKTVSGKKKTHHRQQNPKRRDRDRP